MIIMRISNVLRPATGPLSIAEYTVSRCVSTDMLFNCCASRTDRRISVHDMRRPCRFVAMSLPLHFKAFQALVRKSKRTGHELPRLLSRVTQAALPKQSRGHAVSRSPDAVRNRMTFMAARCGAGEHIELHAVRRQKYLQAGLAGRGKLECSLK